MTAARPQRPDPATDGGASEVFVTVNVAGQLCGLPVRHVRDVLDAQGITRIPLAPPDIAGSLNLRGKIVTAIDLRRRLGARPDPGAPCMSLVTEQGAELYALLVDQVLEVLTLPACHLERVPPTLPPAWRRFSAGVHRLSDGLMVVLDLESVLDFSREAA